MAKSVGVEAERALASLLCGAVECYLASANVVSVDIAYKMTAGQRTDRLCIQFTVTRKLSPRALDARGIRPLPRRLVVRDGAEVPVDVVDVPAARSRTLPSAGFDEYDPVGRVSGSPGEKTGRV